MRVSRRQRGQARRMRVSSDISSWPDERSKTKMGGRTAVIRKRCYEPGRHHGRNANLLPVLGG